MSHYDTNNIFAKILRGEIPCDKIAENEHALAFRDIQPQAPSHLLVIPKGAYTDHADFIKSAADHEILAFERLVAEVALAEGLNPETEGGYRVLSNAGTNAHQEVPHYHVHILGGRPLGPILVNQK